MLNEEKIKIMNKLAMYEQGEGKKYLPVSRYYRSDYIGLAMIKNFFLVTIGYCLILAGIAAGFRPIFPQLCSFSGSPGSYYFYIKCVLIILSFPQTLTVFLKKT